MARRPQPPEHLGDDAVAIWRAVVNSLPGDWFSPGTLPLLAAFCALTVSQLYTLRALQAAERGDKEFDRESWERLQKQLGELSGRIATLATRMRLTPQSRYGARAADTAGRSGPKLSQEPMADSRYVDRHSPFGVPSVSRPRASGRSGRPIPTSRDYRPIRIVAGTVRTDSFGMILCQGANRQ